MCLHACVHAGGGGDVERERPADRDRSGVGVKRETWQWKVWLRSLQLLKVGVKADSHTQISTERTHMDAVKTLSSSPRPDCPESWDFEAGGT